MPRRKIKWKRKKKPSFTKHYEYTSQDEFCIDKIGILQKTYTKIANIIFGEIKNASFGDWQIKDDKIALFIDPEFGMQAELQGTSNMPLLKRLIIHIGLLNFLEKGYTISKAVQLCHLILRKQ